MKLTLLFAVIATFGLFPIAVVGAESTPDVSAHGDANRTKVKLDVDGQSGGSKAPGPSKPSETVVQYFPSCSEITAENGCARKQCENGEQEYVRVESQRGQPERTGILGEDLRCGLPDSSAQSLAIAEFYQTEVFVPAPTVHPRNGLTLVNFPNVYSTEFTGYEQDTDIQTADVRLKFTPVRYIWNFGDGESFTSTVPGEPFDKNRTDRLHEIEETYPVTHRYTDTGDFATTVTILISGEYSVNGGEWQPIGGSIQAISPGSPLNAAEARGELILPDRN